MSLAPRVKAHLQRTGVQYELIEHPHSRNSLQSAQFAKVEPDKVAKAVIIHDGDNYRMCVIPADHRLMLEWLNQGLRRNFRLATEKDLRELFDDCEPGAVPALGQVYGMPVIWDNELEGLADIYLESGDHCHLIHLDHGGFLQLMGLQQHELISCSEAEAAGWMIH